MRGRLFGVVVCLLATLVPTLAMGQCPGGRCRGSSSIDIGGWHAVRPIPPLAWHYVHPIGHRSVVVRVWAFMPDGSRQMGSGVIVRWRGHPVIVTAAHVVRGAVRVTVGLVRAAARITRFAVSVRGIDVRYDMATLGFDPGQQLPPEISQAAVTIAAGMAAVPHPGQELESVGLGGDDQLAANVGSVSRLIPVENGGPSDLMEINGWTREGDSGGPIFTAEGKLAGIISSRDHVTPGGPAAGRLNGIQAGRIAFFLHATYGPDSSPDKVSLPQQYGRGRVPQGMPKDYGVPPPAPADPLVREIPMVPIQRPAPSQAGAVIDFSAMAGCGPNGCGSAGCGIGQGGLLGRLCPQRKPTPPPVPQAPPNVIVQPDPRVGESLDRIAETLQPRAEPPKPAPAGPNGLIVGLVIAAAVVVGIVLFFATQSHTPVD